MPTVDLESSDNSVEGDTHDFKAVNLGVQNTLHELHITLGL